MYTLLACEGPVLSTRGKEVEEWGGEGWRMAPSVKWTSVLISGVHL